MWWVRRRIFRMVEIMSRIHPLRAHGFSAMPEPMSVPKATPIDKSKKSKTSAPVMSKVTNNLEECPNCRCREIMQIEVDVKNQKLRGGTGVGFYLGCPACPWSSPMMSVSHKSMQKPADEGDN